MRGSVGPIALLAWIALWFATAAHGQSEASLLQLRHHTEGALARGDLRAAEMLIETYLPEAARLPDPTWHVFNGHLIACRIKLAMNKTDEADFHAAALRATAAKQGGDDAMERAIAAITTAQVRRQQGREAEAATEARLALAILGRAHQRGRITRQTFETERAAYENVLIAATTAQKSAPATR
jgi:hypothetical protein